MFKRASVFTKDLFRAEGSINLIRVIIFALLGLLFVTKHWVPGYLGSQVYWVHLGLLLTGSVYSLLLFRRSRTRAFPAWVPYLSVVFDVVLITITLVSAPFTSQTHFPDNRFITTSSIYSLYFVTVIFSALRQRPKLTLLAAVLSAALYGGVALSSPYIQTDFHDLSNEIFKVVFLLITGLIATVSARQLANILSRAQKNEEDLLESDRRLRSLGAKIPGAVLQFLEFPRDFWKITYASEGIEELFELPSEILLKHPTLIYEKILPEDKTRLQEKMADAALDNTSWTEEVRVLSDQGGHRWIRFIVSSEVTPHGGRLFHALILNITARKFAELEAQEARAKAEAANEAKTNFLANMSHELRTPLNAILGITELMRQADFPEGQYHNLDILTHAAENLLQIINDVLDFSRLEAGKLRIIKTFFDLKQVLKDVQNLFASQAQSKGLRLQVFIDDSLPDLILGDMVRTRQIVLNLLSNALKFTTLGEVLVHARCTHLKRNAITVEISVKDTGIGIHPMDKDKIFEKFTQADNTKTRIFGGAGLGLSISKSLADLMGGRVEVESHLGQGSCFVFQFPSLQQSHSTSKKETSMNLTDAKLPPLHILLVEDNETNQDVQSRLLQKLGAKVDVASSGHEAIVLVKTHDYDLIFMDWQMPIMDGQETTKMIRIFLEGRPLPIIALSGHALPGDRETLLNSGFDDYISKPVRLSNFREILQKWCLGILPADQDLPNP